MDTGSTDRTKEICRSVGEKGSETFPYVPAIRLYETTWKNDFSIARNECISYATGDWILTLDSDEVLTEKTQKNLHRFLENKPFEPIVYNFKIINLVFENNLIFSPFTRGTLFRNGLGIKYSRPIHEQLILDGIQLRSIDCPELTIFHMESKRPPAETRKKHQNYLKTLLNVINNEPNNPDNYFFYFYLGITYAQLDNFSKALESYLIAYRLFNSGNLPKNSKIYDSILQALIVENIYKQKNYSEAMKFIEELLEINNFSPEGLNYAGYISLLTDKPKEALSNFEKLLIILETNQIVDPDFDNYHISDVLSEIGRCYINIEDDINGIKYLEKALSVNPNSSKCLLFLEKFYFLKRDLAKGIYYHLQNDFGYSQSDKSIIAGFGNITPYSRKYKEILAEFIIKIKQMDVWSEKEVNEMDSVLISL